MDSESPMHRRINALYTHIFADISRITNVDPATLETIETAIDESNIFFWTNAHTATIDKITEARNLLLKSITPAQIISKRLMGSGGDTGALDELPELVKNKIAGLLAETLVN